MGYIPSPPSLHEKFSFTVSNRIPLYVANALSVTPLLFGMIAFSLMEPVFIILWFFPVSLFFALYLSSGIITGFFGKDFDLSKHVALISGSMGYEEPWVDVYIPTCGEDFDVLDNTFRYAAAIEYPNKTVYVLDDSARAGVQRLAHNHGCRYMTRPDRPANKKAGNLRHAFPRTNGEFIVILDADFAPRPDFIRETLPYMLSNPKIAIVQTPQYFDVKESMGWVEAGAGFVQELFYRLIQVTRDTWGASICAGSCALYRRKALEPFGGTYNIGYSEDLHTGWTVMDAGWTVKYIPVVLAKGLCPDKLGSFFSQQYRWCMGSFTLMLNPKFWTSNLTLMQKSCFAMGMSYYIATAMSIIVSPLPFLLLLNFWPEKIHWASPMFAVPSLIFSTLAIGLWTRADWGFYYFRVRALQPWSHLFALVDKILGSAVEWTPTNAPTKSSRYKIYRWVASSWYFILAILFAIGVEAKIANGDWEWLPSGILFLFHLIISLSVIV